MRPLRYLYLQMLDSQIRFFEWLKGLAIEDQLPFGLSSLQLYYIGLRV